MFDDIDFELVRCLRFVVVIVVSVQHHHDVPVLLQAPSVPQIGQDGAFVNGFAQPRSPQIDAKLGGIKYRPSLGTEAGLPYPSCSSLSLSMAC